MRNISGAPAHNSLWLGKIQAVKKRIITTAAVIIDSVSLSDGSDGANKAVLSASGALPKQVGRADKQLRRRK